MDKEHEVTFGTLNPDGELTNVRMIKQSAMLECPWFIMMAMHYRADGSCRCNDSTHFEMQEWGYIWDGDHWQGKPDDDE